MKTTDKIYFDYAATTRVREEVVQAMLPYFGEKFGNPSELHAWGVEARQAVETARKQIADFLGAKEKETIFTACATESINLAHKGLIEMVNGKPHIITTQIEHKAVLAACEHLEKSGQAEVTYLPVDHEGLVSLETLRTAIRPETILVSVMYVNNEVGTIEPIGEIGQLIRDLNQERAVKGMGKIYFHTDATQAIQSQSCRVDELGVDLLSFTGHKFYAPKGVGALYVREGTLLRRQQDGGGQEQKLRAGTENVPYIVGLGEALRLVAREKETESPRLSRLRDKLINELVKLPGVVLTGPRDKRAPHLASFVVGGIEGESLLLLLNEEGIAVSTGSACTASNLAPSHVLTAMGFKPEESHGSVRLSIGKWTTEAEVAQVLAVFPQVVERLRQIAPDLSPAKGKIAIVSH